MILSGPSGVGKDTLLKRWHELNPLVVRVVAYTTRAPRDGESNSVDYNFVSLDTFDRMAAAGDFLEHKQVHGNFYATPLRDMDALLLAGKIAVLKIDVQGAMSAMALRPEALSIFIEPPSWQELERRIRTRGLDSPEDCVKRLQRARAEMDLARHYKHRVVNDDLERAAAELNASVR